ncbi:SusC/RagA family TonB-linked outer membrane protein [Anaerophaga thermohalophila]|uniref:SusC/RagA family TonB-linked outer membrane protein n=1 Tax=Anaerophaga thermohalophila TaxID=177400 RepID=UPI0003120C74|nr:TonB-dependent receptor [Anaerophaga thermohalophila]
MAMKKRVLFLLIGLCFSIASFAQVQVNGSVTDTQGEPVPGVTVLEQGTQNGVITNVDGNYNIEVTGEESVLVFSFVGMETQEIAVGDQREINVVMQETFTDLDEVVVIGYGVQQKKLNTGATVQVKSDQIVKQNTVSPMTAMQGLTPGVSIIKETGEPGSGFKVNIRGMGTTGDSEPLVVIDGVPGGNLDYLSPADIESIDVLKDAASAAIYGSRAANGVILVTTKTGSRGLSKGAKKATITYDGSYGVQNLYKKLPVATAQEYAVLLNEARVNSQQPLLDFASLVPDWERIESGEWKGTDWLEHLTVEDAPIQNHALNIFGGGENSTYSLGLSYTDQEGIFGGPVNSQYERYSFRLNSDYALLRDASDSFDVLKVGETLRYSYSKRSGIGTGNQYLNDIFSSTVASPFLPMYDENGEYHDAIPWNPQEANPIASMIYQRGQNESKSYNLNGSIYLEVQPIKGLKYRSQFGYNMNAGSYRSYTPTYSLSATVFREHDQVSHNLDAGYSWTWENTVNYDFDINVQHSFNVLAGMSAEKWGLGEHIEGTNIDALLSGFKYAWLKNTPVINDDGTTSMSSSPWGEGGILSYFGRVSYDYLERYMLTLIMRADGSSNFPEENRWGYFPSVSAGWVLTEEPFMGGLDGTLDFMKLRASWGQNGNQSIDAFQYLSTISYENVNYFFGPDKTDVSIGGYPSILPNPDITWETSEQLNIGVDLRLLRSRLGVTFDWYTKTTKDWLVRADNLASFGTGAPFINGGDVENKGIELAITWSDRMRDFSYDIGLNFAYNQNEVTRIANSEGIIYGPGDILGQGTNEVFRAQEGYPIGYFRGYETLGVFQNEEEIQNYTNSEGDIIQPNAVPGDLIFADTNDDGTISDEDKKMIGDPNPDYIVGLNMNFAYKGFDLSVVGNGAFGHQIARSYRRWNDSPTNNFTTDIFDRWHGEGSSNKYPRLTYGAHPNWQYVSDIFIEDADYFRISNITFGYDFTRIAPNLPFEQARLFVTGQNVYTFTNYFGMDPEIGTSTNDDYPWAKGIDIGYYPSPRTVLVGVSVKF